MTKAELIERTIDRITDPWAESCEDYADAELIDMDVAKEILNQCHYEDLDFEPEYRLPKEVTPELMMIAYNCNVRKNKHELRVKRLAEYITDNEMVCEYSNYYMPTLEDPVDVIPVDFLYNSTRFPFSTHNTENPDIIDVLHIGMNSAKTFNRNHEFCWFDKDTETLHSTNHPFRKGILDAKAFAEYILSDEGKECFDYIAMDIMSNDDFRKVFGCDKEEVFQ